MSHLDDAGRDAADAAANSQHLALVLALLEAQKLTHQPPAAPPPAATPNGSAAKWIGIGVGGSVFLLTVAVSAVAVAISAVALTACLLVLRSMWREFQKRG